MEEFAEELRTPPVALVSLVGCPELHPTISAHLHSDQPPINTLALPDFSNLPAVFSNKDDKDSNPSSSAGILKRDWLLKHRTRRPAVVAALFTSQHISGDPAQWLQVSTELDNLKAVIRGRNIRLLLIIVQSTADDISEDRLSPFCKRAELDPKHLIVMIPNDASELKQSLSRISSALAELANSYYKDEGRNIKMRTERKSSISVESYIRYCFKVAVYAEFRRDWAEALRSYEDAYHALREMVGTSTRLPAIQRLVEIKSMAEILSFKISTLLLHGGRIMEAVTWFRQHIGSYRRLEGAPEVAFMHWEWMSRQFLVFAELLETSSATVQGIPSLDLGTASKSFTEWDLLPAYYYQFAANYLKEKRSCFEVSLSMTETGHEISGNDESVIPSAFVGQFARLLEESDELSVQLLTDEEYVRYTLSEGKRFQDAFEIIALLKKSSEWYANLKALRIASFCWFQMGVEYFSLHDYTNSKQVFDRVASLYRKEGWVILLWEVLGYLREVCRRQSELNNFVEYSLEMAALPVVPDNFKECGPEGPACLSQRETIHKEVFGLVRGESDLTSEGDGSMLKVTEDRPVHLEIDLVSPLRVVFLASVAFHEQTVKPGLSTMVTLSLLSQLPLAVEIDQLEVQFNQAECNFTIINGQKRQLAADVDGKHIRRMEAAPFLELVPNQWLRLAYDIKSEQSGKLECISVIAKMGDNFTVCCRAESPASMNDLPPWKFEDRVDTYPTKDPALAFTGQKAIQVEEPEAQVDLTLASSGPALVGEGFIIPVNVASKSHAIHSGELKINLVDVRGSGLVSPREAEPFSTDSHHVELISVVTPEGEETSNGIRKIQHSFGLVSVPFIDKGGSWACKLEIKWHRPKPVLIYVSLGYLPQNSESCTSKIHVHKSLQIEGKTAVVVNHQFMLPFRSEPLLLSSVKPAFNREQLTSVPSNKSSVLVVSTRNCTEVPLQLLSVYLEVGDEDNQIHLGKDPIDSALLVPGEEFKRIFPVIPEENSAKLRIGAVCLKWRRFLGAEQQEISSTEADVVLSKHKLPDVNLEQSPLVVSWECPPHAVLGTPFTYFVKISNQTKLLQEIRLSLTDSQSFVVSGSHTDVIFVLPKSEHILSYKLVPLASGSHQLPRVTLNSVRYSVVFQASSSASSVVVFPSERDA